MASSGGAKNGPRPAPPRSGRSASVVVPLPHARSGDRLWLARLVPSGRSLLVAFALLLGAGGAYVVARETSVFAVRTVAVEGASPSLTLQVRRALRDDLGTSLLRVDLARAGATLTALPTVAAASFDRALPHTLRVVVVPERPVAVLRRGAASWLVSAQGRVMASLLHGARPRLPRVWIGKGTAFTVGRHVGAELRPALEAVTPLAGARFPARVASVRAGTDELTLVLRSGLEVRLGDTSDVLLKLAVAAKVLPLVASDARYVDLSVPARPVAGSAFTSTPPAPAAASSRPATSGTSTPQVTPTATAQTLKSQVEGKTATSTGP